MEEKTKCINQCKLDKSGQYCLGCKRTSEDITMWSLLSEDQRDAILNPPKYIQGWNTRV
jgi:predicted Fe-S protein YdhL (DUF1289 family)